MMRVFPGWRVHFALGDSGVVISSDAVLVGGRRFWDCGSIVELSERCQKSVDFGPSEPLDDSMNRLWRRILSRWHRPNRAIPTGTEPTVGGDHPIT